MLKMKTVVALVVGLITIGVASAVTNGRAQSADHLPQLVGTRINANRDMTGTITWRQIELKSDGSYIESSGRGNSPGPLIKGKWGLVRGQLYEKMEVIIPNFGFAPGTETLLALSMPDMDTAIIAGVRFKRVTQQ